MEAYEVYLPGHSLLDNPKLANTVREIEDEEKFISSMEKQWDDKLCFGYAIVDKHTDTIMGAIDIHAIAWEHNRCEIG